MASSVGPSALILANFLKEVEDRFQELGLLVLDELQGASPRRFRDIIPSMQLVGGEWRQGGWQYGEWQEFDWGRRPRSSHVQNPDIVDLEVNVDAVFYALDREHYTDDSNATVDILSQSDTALDFLWAYMGLAEALPYMLSCQRLRDQLVQCYPFWSRIIQDLRRLTSDAVFHIPTNTARPAFLLYQICAKVLKEVRPAPSLKYAVDPSPVKSIPLMGDFYRFKSFPSCDLVGVISTQHFPDGTKKKFLEVFTLSRVSNGISEYIVELNGEWLIKDFFIAGKNVVFWLGGLDGGNRELDWEECSPIVSFPLELSSRGDDWKPTEHLDPAFDVKLVSVSQDYIAAVVKRRHAVTHNQELYLWPIVNGCYAVDRIVRPLGHFVSDLALHGTLLATLCLPRVWDRMIRDGSTSHHPTHDLRFQTSGQPIRLDMTDLGPPSDAVASPMATNLLTACHKDDMKLYSKGSFTTRLRIVNPKSPFHDRNPTDPEISHQTESRGYVTGSGPDFLRVGPFVASSHSFGQFYHLEEPTHGPLENPYQYTVLNVRRNARTPIATFLTSYGIIRYFFSGPSILYSDGGRELMLRRLPLV